MTQKEKILTLMCRQPDKWFYVYDFMRGDLGDLFVGYKAESRISELNNDYPEMFDRQVDGKYMKRRIRHREVAQWFGTLPKEFRQIVAKQLDYYPHIPDNKYNAAKEKSNEQTTTENLALFPQSEITKPQARRFN